MRGSKVIGRYVLHDAIASGGMARVHLGRLVGEGGFAKTVAIKRLHPMLAEDPAFVRSLLDEARLSARIQHQAVVPTLDVVSADGELLVVMEYVAGESLAGLVKQTPGGIAAPIACSIATSVLHGLHAAHEATDEDGQPLGIVHRDVSPQNVLVGSDGVARLLDFGVAKARGRLASTGDGQVKGKVPYMSPEQLLAGDVDRRTDVYATGVVLWEALTGQRLFIADDHGALIGRVLDGRIEPPGARRGDIAPELDALVMRALSKEPGARFETAWDFAVAIEETVPTASTRHIAEWVRKAAGDALERRATLVANIERKQKDGPAGPAEPLTPSTPAASAKTAGPDDITEASELGQVSQVSSLSVSSGKHSAASEGGRSWAGLAVAAMLVGGGVAFALLGGPGAPETDQDLAATGAAPDVATAAVITPSVTPSVTPTAMPTVAPSASTAPLETSARVPAPPVAPPVTAPSPAEVTGPKTDCDPPYVIGGDGIKRLKKGCH